MRYDFIFVGGGLANLVSAYRLKITHPHLRTLVLEAKSELGGEHTWSVHESDISAGSWSWFRPLLSKSWKGYDVFFPQLSRSLKSDYHSIDSAEFVEKVTAAGVTIRLGVAVTEVSQHAVKSAGESWAAECVLDGRGWQSAATVCAYQKFLGQRVQLSQPHSLTRPTIMDARVPQKDGYRFVYVLPWSDTEVLIEDTRYSDTPDVQVEAYRMEIRDYCASQGLSVEKVTYEEIGVLPIVLNGELPSSDNGVIPWGTRGGFFQPTTGYSLPTAIENAEKLSGLSSFRHSTVYPQTQIWMKQNWKRGRFLRGLNRMMFYAAAPEERFRILQRFYGLPGDLIERFYAGKLTIADQARILSGRPPVSVTRALKALWHDPLWREANEAS